VRWPVGFYRVAGESMMPTLLPGQLLVGLRWRQPQIGDIVVLRLDRSYVKRLTRREGLSWWVEGDNQDHSHDSRAFGAVSASTLEAIIVWPRR
jgi:phage repressor protein C with HTH and peptisase S24 domain